MKKLVLYIILFLCTVSSYAQGPPVPGSSYKNLQKYWWYRYRLVNDFMKIGPGCGESIPAQRRDKGAQQDVYDYDGSYLGKININTLQWGDATIDLGNYISMLATEHRMLQNNSLSVNRTNFELYYALNAFERLDRNAEARIYDIDGTYPCNYQAVPEKWRDQINGFFVRDDVPVEGFVEINKWGIMNPKSHFNRPGIRNLFPINNSLVNCAADDINYPGRTTPVVWPYTERRMPSEESTDQVIQILMGLSLTSKLLHGESYIHPGTRMKLADKSRQNIHKIIEHIASSSRGSRVPFLNWQIVNPVTKECVIGIEHGAPNPCNAGGGEHFALATAASKTSEQWGLGYSYGTPYKSVWNASQHVLSDRDGNFQGTYAALTNSWKNTWKRMKHIGTINGRCSPHLPYLYRIMHEKGLPFNYAETITTLDAAPGCGIHNYKGIFSTEKTFGDYELNSLYAYQWSGNNLLHEWYSRAEIDYVVSPKKIIYKPKDTYRDYNGLDYMTLFNLFNLQIDYPAKYINYYFNSYYKEDFKETYPQGSALFDGKTIGDHVSKLKLNFLEYLSARNVLNSDGNLAFRGGKVIDLLPGFETMPGSAFLAYVQDYEIDCGSYAGKDERGNDIGTAGESYHYAEITGPKSIWNPESGVLPQGQQTGDTTFYPDVPPDGVSYEGDTSFHFDTDTLADMTCEDARAYFDTLVAEIYASGDSVQIAYIDSLIPRVSFPECDSTSGGAGATSRTTSKQATRSEAQVTLFNIYPNPGKGHFTFTFSDLGDYEIKISNILGTVVYRTYVYKQRSELVSIDGLPNGVYTAEVINGSGPLHKQVRKLIISH